MICHKLLKIKVEVEDQLDEVVQRQDLAKKWVRKSFFLISRKNIFTQQDAFWLYCDKLFIIIQSEHHSFYRKTQPTEECK